MKKMLGGKGIPKTGLAAKGVLRPHVWIVGPDEYKHSMYMPWQKAKAQANFRGEGWELEFEDFFNIWNGYWDQRGRASEDLCLTRIDPELAWSWANCELIVRAEHLRRQNLRKMNFGSNRKR